jgi:hypothetical protein
MAGSIPAASGRIFISYRREETAYPAGWLYDRLTDRYGGGQVFKDVDSIQLGDDFVEVITRAVGSCDVLLALIGNEWLTITDEHGRRRLDDPDDFVRLEIEAALSRRVRVIPILVDGARMPRADELPDSLSALMRRQALELSPTRFDFDTSRLLKVLDRTLTEVRATHQDAASVPAATGTARDLSPTGLPEAPEQQEQGERTPTPSIPPAAFATPAGRSPLESDKPPHQQRRRLSTRVRVLAGAGVGIVLILAIVAIVASSGTPSSTGAVTTTPLTTGAVTTTSPPTDRVIFQDDFSSQASEWGPYEPETGRYTNGAYRISAPPSADGSGAGASPGNASEVSPSAPSDIRIEVKGRRLPASDQSMEYGVACRIDGDNAYVFTISDNYAEIAKYGAQYKALKETEVKVNAYSTNRLRAICTSIKGKQAVHLELWVNGRKAVETTDTDNPLPTGTVGLVVGTYQTKRVSVAEFDNFVVTQV